MNGDLADQNSIDNAVSTTQPDEFYNLGAMSFVPESWRSPMMTADITGLGALRCLEAIVNMLQIVNSTKRGLRAIRKGKRCTSDRENSFPPEVSIWMCKSFRF